MTDIEAPSGAGLARSPERLLAEHYAEFRRIAARVLRSDSGDLLLQPTELAHEAALRLMRLDRLAVQDRAHFLALAVRVMRQVLLDEVRRARAAKRRPAVHTAWPHSDAPQASARFDIEAFDAALAGLAEIDPQRARVVELRFYAGLTLEEVAATTGESLSTVKRRWRVARAWLLAALEDG